MSKLLSSPNYNLWKNSLDTINWFKNIKNKKRSTFIKFNIIEFYPSITRQLLLKSLNHDKEYTDITNKEIEIILAWRKSILSDNHRTWVKSHGHLQLSPSSWLNKVLYFGHFGLYYQLRAGGVLPGWWNGPKTSKIQKKIIRAFKLLGLQIQITSNLKIVDFLDVTFNLNNGIFKPFSKNNSTPTYVNIDSNHPRSLLK